MEGAATYHPFHAEEEHIEIVVGDLRGVTADDSLHLTTVEQYADRCRRPIEESKDADKNHLLLPDCELTGVPRIFRENARDLLAMQAVECRCEETFAKVSIVCRSPAKVALTPEALDRIDGWEWDD